MLVQIDKIQGVTTAMTNRSGTLIRIRLTDARKAESVTEQFMTILKSQGRTPTEVSGKAADVAIRDAEWRGVGSVGELSEIEFRTVFSRRVKQFVESESLNEQTSKKLLELSQQVLAEAPRRTKEDAWSEFCRDLATGLIEKSKDILTKEQLEQLQKRLSSRIRS